MASESIPAAIDRLYEVPPAGFVQARNALVKSLKAAGHTDHAAAAAKLSRPTVSVWATNQVARRAADLVAELGEATARLQGGVTRDREKYAAAINHHRDLLNQVRERVEAVLTGAGLRAAPSAIAAAVQNFRTGLMDAQAQPLLLKGQLTDDVGLEAGAGLFGLAGAFGPDEGHPAPRQSPAKSAVPHAGDAKARDRERRQEERERREQARAVAKARGEAERRVHAARRASAAAAAAREKQEFAVASARRELESAERKLAEVRTAERQAAAALAEAQSAVDQLRGRSA